MFRFVVFAVFKELAAGVDVTPGEIAVTFVRLSIGGPLWGLAMGVGTGYLMRFRAAAGDPLTEISILVCGVYTTFFLAEHHLRVSGVLAVVVFGAYLGKVRQGERQQHWFMIGAQLPVRS